MQRLLTDHGPAAPVQGPGPELKGPVDTEPKLPVDKSVNKSADKPVDNPVDTPVETPVAAEPEKKKRPHRRVKPAPEAIAVDTTVEDQPLFRAPVDVDPAEIVRIRQIVEDLQAAYADGHQKEVFELLSRFGNGAKSFRELPPDAFLPIREAIDNGALT